MLISKFGNHNSLFISCYLHKIQLATLCVDFTHAASDALTVVALIGDHQWRYKGADVVRGTPVAVQFSFWPCLEKGFAEIIPDY